MIFPFDIAGILMLAHTVNEGLKANTETFKEPPSPTTEMDADLTAYDVNQSEIIASEAVTARLKKEKKLIFQRIKKKTKQNIRYGESVADGNEAVLALIGWGNPSKRKPIQPPGQPRVFEIIGQGDGWVQSDWKAPIDGGKVASYTIKRSEDGGEMWTDAGTFTESEAILLNQPKGKKLFYQVVAQNKAGVSVASNTVSLTL